MIRLLPAQQQLLEATGRLVAFIAGYGAGKTFSACLKAIQLAGLNPGCVGAFLEPTFKMCRMIAMPDMETACKALGVKYRWRLAEFCLEVWVGDEPEWTKIFFMSADKPESLDGLNLAWAILDEAGQCKEAVAKKLLARMRDPRATQTQFILVSTPEGGPGTWLGQWAEFGPPHVVANTLIRARTVDNPYLKKEYLEEMRARYTPDEYLGYCEGYFVAQGGQVYRWDSTRNTRTVEIPSPMVGEIQIFADFNVVKVVWLLAWVHGGLVHVFDEVIGSNQYTEEMCPKVQQRLRKWDIDPVGIKIYHDANVSSRSATASRDKTGKSDVHYCKIAGFVPKARRQNPPIRDRVAAVNAKLKEGTLFVADRCTELKASLATQGRDANGQPDKSGGLDHAPDALGYGIFYQWPVRPLRDPNAPTRYA